MTNMINVLLRSANGDLVLEKYIELDKIRNSVLIIYKSKYYIYQSTQFPLSATYVTFVEVNNPTEIT